MTNMDHIANTARTNTALNAGQDANPMADLIVSELLNIIRKHTKNAGEDWTAATTLEDVGIDSFDLVELIFEVEDKYDISINFNANKTADDFSTVGDVANLIEEGLAKEGRTI